MTGTERRQHAKGPQSLEAAFPQPLSLASRSIHADDYINTHRAVAPAMHVSTTFRYSDDPDQLKPWDNVDPAAPFDSHIYSRVSAPNTTRLEAILGSLLGGPTITYASGLAGFHALIVFLNPKRVAIGGGYHGCYGVLDLVSKLSGLEQLDLLKPDDLQKLQPGDVIHVETPVNPTGEARDLDHYAGIAREKGCYLTVDATFAPPPLSSPFSHGVDIIMHSGTKYFGGHSDMLCGVLAVSPGRVAESWPEKLKAERLHLGSVMGSFEGWLGVRSLRTVELRVERQSSNAANLVKWLAGKLSKGDNVVSRVVSRIQHTSLQKEASEEGSWLRRQMPRGYAPVFALWMKDEDAARRLPSKLLLFHHATSLGGVESLVEWRALTDRNVDKRLLRISVGIEGWEDLKADLEAGFNEVADSGSHTDG